MLHSCIESLSQFRIITLHIDFSVQPCMLVHAKLSSYSYMMVFGYLDSIRGYNYFLELSYCADSQCINVKLDLLNQHALHTQS